MNRSFHNSRTAGFLIVAIFGAATQSCSHEEASGESYTWAAQEEQMLADEIVAMQRDTGSTDEQCLCHFANLSLAESRQTQNCPPLPLCTDRRQEGVHCWGGPYDQYIAKTKWQEYSDVKDRNTTRDAAARFARGVDPFGNQFRCALGKSGDKLTDVTITSVGENGRPDTWYDRVRDDSKESAEFE